MAGIIRVGDYSTADPCGAPARPADSGSSNVFINGKAAVRAGDTYAEHACPDSPPHTGVAEGGSASVFINGQPAHRTGDGISCGSKAGEGSPDVSIG